MVELDRVENRAFDTVFCFGFFYHTLDHMVLLRKIARIKPTSLVLDTSISMRAGSIIEVGDEEVELEGCAAFADAGTPVRAIIGFPSKSAVEIMLKAAGFSDLRYWDWMRAGIRRWNDLQDYYLGERITLRAKRAD